MSTGPRKRLVLGPQQPRINLGEAVARFDIGDGPVAVVAAGWQEAEAFIDDIQALVPAPLVNLDLYQRADDLFDAQAAFRDAYRARQEKLIEQQRLHQIRLRQMMIATRRTLRASGDAEMIAEARRHALDQLQELDRHHLEQVQQIHHDFDTEANALPATPLDVHREEIAEILSACETVLITGGNVLVLLNRLRLFGTDRELADKHLITWSAGAMVLSDQVVLYHDNTPLSRRDAEILDAGTGDLPGYVFLPDARHRLRESDVIRTGLMCQRFAPRRCLALDNGSELLFEGPELTRASAARVLTADGRYDPLVVT